MRVMEPHVVVVHGEDEVHRVPVEDAVRAERQSGRDRQEREGNGNTNVSGASNDEGRFANRPYGLPVADC
jgi:hypothetical protein